MLSTKRVADIQHFNIQSLQKLTSTMQQTYQHGRCSSCFRHHFRGNFSCLIFIAIEPFLSFRHHVGGNISCLIFIAIELFSSFKPLNQTSCSSCYNCHCGMLKELDFIHHILENHTASVLCIPPLTILMEFILLLSLRDSLPET